MKKFLAAVAATGLLLSVGVGFANAAPKKAEDGSRPNDHGLCTAYFNGQKNGWDKKDSPPGQFATLVAESPDGSDEGDTAGDPADVFEHCNSLTDIGGNPDHSGRWTCTAEVLDDPSTPETDESEPAECTDNPAPGNSGA